MDLKHAAPVVGLSHIQLHVSDLDASIAWYSDVLSLEFLRGDPPRYVVMQSPTGHFRMVLSAGGTAENHGALDHIAFMVSDLPALENWVEHLTELGIAHKGIKENPVGRSVDLFDPDGNNIELVSEV